MLNRFARALFTRLLTPDAPQSGPVGGPVGPGLPVP